MSIFQLSIIFLVLAVVVVILIYYIYDDLKYKKKIHSSFNLSTDDVLMNNEKITILDADNDHENKIIMQKDIFTNQDQRDSSLIFGEELENINSKEFDIVHDNSNFDNNLNENSQSTSPIKELNESRSTKIIKINETPIGSMEAFFEELDQIVFPFHEKINNQLDLVIDIYFEETQKLKILPQINQYISMQPEYFVLNKNLVWVPYSSGKKYEAKALKLIISLVDNECILNQDNINFIYKELHQYVINNDGHLRFSDYKENLIAINNKCKMIKDIRFLFQIFIKIPAPISGAKLHKYLIENSFLENNGIYYYNREGINLFQISAENDSPINKKEQIYLILISSKLHLVNNILDTFDKIFDFGEEFMRNFDAKMFTFEKKLINQSEFDILNNQVEKYQEFLNNQNIKSGEEIIQRIFK